MGKKIFVLNYLLGQIGLKLFELFAKLKQQGLTILLVEQNVQQALKISDRAYILDQGEIVFHDTAQNLLNNDEIQQKYCAV